MSVIKSELANFFPTPFLFCDLSKKTIKQLETAVIKDFRNDCEDFDTYLKTKNAEEDHQLKQNLTSFCKAEGFPIYQSTQELQLHADISYIKVDEQIQALILICLQQIKIFRNKYINYFK